MPSPTSGTATFFRTTRRELPGQEPSPRVKALKLLGMLAGTLQLSRALTDRQLSDELLEQGIRNALALLGTEQHN